MDHLPIQSSAGYTRGMTNPKPSPIVLVTGGSRGLGRSMAEHLAARGVDIILTYRSNQDAAESVLETVRAHGRSASALPLDVSDPSRFDEFGSRLDQTLKSDFGGRKLTYLINNAGSGIHVSFAETSPEQLSAMFAEHVQGPFLITQMLLSRLEDGGAILNVSSGLARFTIPGYGAYAAMKGAVEVLTRYQARELGARGIRVNVLAPGAIETDFGGGAVRDNRELNQFVAQTTALGRAGLPEDVGRAVASLLSPDTAWITGQRIEVSGGQSI